MKLKLKIIYLFLVFSGFLASCGEDFLDRPSLSEIAADNFYQTPEDLGLATASLYAGEQWAEWTYLSYLPVGEVLSGNMAMGYNGDAVQFNTFAVTNLNGMLVANWKGMYNVIAHCNVNIKAITEQASATIPEEVRNAALAEARFIRAFAYYDLAMLWGPVPIIEDNTTLINSPFVRRNELNDVYQFIVNDLTFAVKHLPEGPDVAWVDWADGRVTTWSAQGLLSKVYLTWSGLGKSAGSLDESMLDSAAFYAGNVCKNSGLNLLENYADLFTVAHNDNEESLFALQWDPNMSGWLGGNMLQLFSSGGVEISANGSPGWFGIHPTYDIYLKYSEKDTIRRKATFMLRDDYYPELNAAKGGFTYTGDAGLKKHIIGTREDNNAPTMTQTTSAEHNALLRLADVYLLYAEAILGNSATTADVDALMYFNLVRQRAGLDPVDVLDFDTILKERRLELAGESQYWFDLVRLSYYNPSKAASILNNQERVRFEYDGEVATPGDAWGEVTPANDDTFRLPLPAVEVTANNKLLAEPVPYF